MSTTDDGTLRFELGPERYFDVRLRTDGVLEITGPEIAAFPRIDGGVLVRSGSRGADLDESSRMRQALTRIAGIRPEDRLTIMDVQAHAASVLSGGLSEPTEGDVK